MFRKSRNWHTSHKCSLGSLVLFTHTLWSLNNTPSKFNNGTYKCWTRKEWKFHIYVTLRSTSFLGGEAQPIFNLVSRFFFKTKNPPSIRWWIALGIRVGCRSGAWEKECTQGLCTDHLVVRKTCVFFNPKHVGVSPKPLWNWMESSKKETFLELIHRETQGLEQRFKQKNWSDMFLIKFWLLYEDPYVMAYYNRYRFRVVQSPNSKQPEFLVTAQFGWASWNLFVHPKGDNSETGKPVTWSC